MPRAIVIARPGAEVTTKKNRTRARFQQTLRANVHEALERRGLAPSVSLELARLFVEVDDVEQASRVLARSFGVASYSPVEAVVAADLSAIVEAGRQLFSERVRGKRYAVRAKRQGKHAFSSLDIEIALGRALNAEATVDLERPDIWVRVEALGERAYLFSHKLPGPGGLPCGVRGRALVLISGGFDSAVAAWRIMKRGVAVDFVLLDLGGRAYERRVLSVVRVLAEAWGAGLDPRLHVVPFDAVVTELKRNVRSQYWQVVLKRMMYRAAERVAREIGAQALVTGECIGQVSSQTLANLVAIHPAASMPVLRPLIGHDKMEIIAEARRIGTAALSERVKEYCAIGANFPVTATDSAKVDRQERHFDQSLIEQAVRARRVIDPTRFEPDERRSYLLTRRIPSGAVVIDCQPPHLYRAWHAPGAQHREPGELIDNLRRLDKDATYVLYCTYGPQAAHLAELMQRSGYDAYAFDGGAELLRRSLG